MASRNLNGVLRYLRRLAGSPTGDGASDAELLERYVRLGERSGNAPSVADRDADG
jgi:hypothetical protein